MLLKQLRNDVYILIETFILKMKYLVGIRTLGSAPFLLEFLHWTFISGLWTCMFIIWLWILIFHYFLDFLLFIITSLNYKSMILSIVYSKRTHLDQFIFLLCQWIKEFTQRRHFPIRNNMPSSIKSRYHKLSI